MANKGPIEWPKGAKQQGSSWWVRWWFASRTPQISKSGSIFSGLGLSARDIFDDTAGGMTTSDTSIARPSRVSLVSGFGCIYLVWGTTYLAIRLAVADRPPFSWPQ